MRNMKIGCIIIGNKITHTQQALKEGSSLDLADCTKWDQPVDEALLNKIKDRMKAAAPKGAEVFYEHITSENQMIDVQEADAYVAVPFGNKNDSLMRKSGPTAPSFSHILSAITGRLTATWA